MNSNPPLVHVANERENTEPKGEYHDNLVQMEQENPTIGAVFSTNGKVATKKTISFIACVVFAIIALVTFVTIALVTGESNDQDSNKLVPELPPSEPELPPSEHELPPSEGNTHESMTPYFDEQSLSPQPISHETMTPHSDQSLPPESITHESMTPIARVMTNSPQRLVSNAPQKPLTGSPLSFTDLPSNLPIESNTQYPSSRPLLRDTNNPSNSPETSTPITFPIQWIMSEWTDQNGQNRCIRLTSCSRTCGFCCRIHGTDPTTPGDNGWCQTGWRYNTQKKTLEDGNECLTASSQYGLVTTDCASNIDSTQQWEISAKNQIVHIESGKCVEITGSDVTIYSGFTGTSVILNDCQDIINQRFIFVSEDPSYSTRHPSNSPNTEIPSNIPSHQPNTQLPSGNPFSSSEPSNSPVNVVCIGHLSGPTQLRRGMPKLTETALTSSYEIEFDFHLNSWFDDNSWPGVVCHGILHIGPDDTTYGSDYDGGYPDIEICESGSGGDNYWRVSVWDRYRSRQTVIIGYPNSGWVSPIGDHHVFVSVEPTSFSVTIDGETRQINKADANIPNDYRYPIWFGHPAGTPADGIISNLCIRKKI